jgi:hypothetical protein
VAQCAAMPFVEPLPADHDPEIAEPARAIAWP